MIKKISLLLICLFILAQSVNAFPDNGLFVRYQVGENESYQFTAVPKNQYEFTFKPQKKGEWQIEISHNTTLLEDKNGLVIYVQANGPEADESFIEIKDVIQYKEINPVMLEVNEIDSVLVFYVLNNNQIPMDVEITIVPFLK